MIGADEVPSPRARLRALLLALGLLSTAVPGRAASFPPEFRFRTLAAERVSVHFHDGHEQLARQAAAIAEQLLAQHEARYGQRVGRVQIVLVDSEDEPNGFASPLPYPLVNVRVAAPNGSEGFGNHEGWLWLVLSHELAHVVHLEQAHGLWRAGRALFGRAPFLFPNSLAMSWMIEGLATYEETEHTAFGRGRNPDSRMVLRMAALEGRFVSEDQAIYALDAWPAGQAAYLFGEGFLRDLAGDGGPAAVPALARQHARQVIPFLDGRSVKKVTGRGLAARWREWAREATAGFEAEAAGRRAAGLTQARVLTRRGIRQERPRFSPDGAWIAYSSGSLTRFPEIRLVRPDGSEDHALELRNAGSGLAWTPDGASLVYAELQVHRTFAVYSELSAIELASGQVRRLTRGVRASEPDVSPDGRSVVFVRRLGDRSDLYLLPIEGGEPRRLTSSASGVEWSGPRFSPDGRSLAASRLLPGGWLDVVLVGLATGNVEQLTHDRAADVEPTWTPDGRGIVFRSQRDGVSNLYALDVADRSLARVTNVLGGAFQPCVSPDGATVAFSDYSARGYDIVVAPLAREPMPAPQYDDEHPAPRPDPAPVTGQVRPYRPAAALLPRFWSPWIETGGDETKLGAATGGTDPLFRHLWAVRGTYGTRSGRANVSGYYVYDRFRTTFTLSGEDTSEVFEETAAGSASRTLTGRTRQLALGAALPLRRTLRSSQALVLRYRLESRDASGSPSSDRSWQTGGLELGWQLSSARAYPYSISPVDGGRLALAWLHASPSLGSDDAYDKLTFDGRYYRRLLGERDVLAAQLKLGTTRGEPRFQPFAAGGYPDSSLFDSSANLALLRGYEDGAFLGRHFASANLEYRFPLVSPQHGWRSLPVFLRHLRGTLFADAGHAWSGAFDAGELRRALGASLGVDAATGYTLPVSAELSVARALDDPGDTKVYLRLGLAF